MNGYSQRFEDALALAATTHRDQVRKQTNLPYITHLCHVAHILTVYDFDEATTIAGLLHDIVEDQGYPLAKIQAQFGDKVATIVAALTERKRDVEGHKRAWELRKEEGVAQMEQAPRDAVAVKIADALHNVSTIVADWQREGAKVWDRFNRGPEQTTAYYQRIAAVGRQRLGDHPLVLEYEIAAERLSQLTQAAT